MGSGGCNSAECTSPVATLHCSVGLPHGPALHVNPPANQYRDSNFFRPEQGRSFPGPPSSEPRNLRINPHASKPTGLGSILSPIKTAEEWEREQVQRGCAKAEGEAEGGRQRKSQKERIREWEREKGGKGKKGGKSEERKGRVQERAAWHSHTL